MEKIHASTKTLQNEEAEKESPWAIQQRHLRGEISRAEAEAEVARITNTEATPPEVSTDEHKAPEESTEKTHMETGASPWAKNLAKEATNNKERGYKD